MPKKIPEDDKYCMIVEWKDPTDQSSGKLYHHQIFLDSETEKAVNYFRLLLYDKNVEDVELRREKIKVGQI